MPASPATQSRIDARTFLKRCNTIISFYKMVCMVEPGEALRARNWGTGGR
jgi:hypothetical protein